MSTVKLLRVSLISIFVNCAGPAVMAETAEEKSQRLIDTSKYPEASIFAATMLCEELAARLDSENHSYWREKVDEEAAMMLSTETAKSVSEFVLPAVELAIMRKDKKQLAAWIAECDL